MKKETSCFVASPCIRNCCLDEQGICIGCFRSMDEIIGWSASSSQQRREIIEQTTLRLNEHQQKYL